MYPKIFKLPLDPKIWAQPDATAIYSTSIVERATRFWFLVAKEMKDDPKKWSIPEVLFL